MNGYSDWWPSYRVSITPPQNKHDKIRTDLREQNKQHYFLLWSSDWLYSIFLGINTFIDDFCLPQAITMSSLPGTNESEQISWSLGLLGWFLWVSGMIIIQLSRIRGGGIKQFLHEWKQRILWVYNIPLMFPMIFVLRLLKLRWLFNVFMCEIDEIISLISIIDIDRH